MEEGHRRQQPPPPPPPSTSSPTAQHHLSSSHQPAQSHLFPSTQLPLPHPPLHLQNQRYPPSSHSLHPSLSPSVAAAYPTPPWQHPPPPPSRHSLRDDYGQSTPQSQHLPPPSPSSRHAVSRLDISRPIQYQDSRSHSHNYHHLPPSQHSHQHLQSVNHGRPHPRGSPPPIPHVHTSRNTPPSATTPNDDALPPTSDFVKKLFKMLEDPTFHSVVCWGPEGDCFIVKDMNEFTKTILPKMFKHSNFASFVRQLNKYDFHKVKNAEATPGGDQAWTFKHPDFHAKRRDALENIKRKVPSQRKAQQAAATSGPATGQAQSGDNAVTREEYDNLLERLEETNSRLQETESNYQSVLSQLSNVQQTITQQDGLMHQLITYFINFENTKIASPPTSQSHSTPTQHPQRPLSPPMLFSGHPNGASHLTGAEPTRVINLDGNTTEEVARQSFEQMNEMSLRARDAGITFRTNGHGGSNGSSSHPPVKQESVENTNGAPVPHPNLDPNVARRSALDNIHREFKRIHTPLQQLPESAPGQLVRQQQTGFDGYPVTQVNGTKPDSPHQGLQVFTVGHIMPRGSLEASGLANDSNIQSWQYDGTSLQQLPGEPGTSASGAQSQQSFSSPTFKNSPQSPPMSVPSSEPAASTSTAGTRPALRVRRSTFVPAWSVPPRVLLVEDDAVSRRLSSKFLQVFGCTIDVAVDGDSAVNKMNLEKYDLVLMDIVMPKLDGVSATSLIRKFDPRTPIISMTSNSKPHDIMYYFSQGMNDILPKPFTKEGLLDMLEKHLFHLKVADAIRNHVPRGVGIPPLNDENFNQALMVASQSYNGHGPPLLAQANGESADQEEGKTNPFAGMGLSDEHYAMILQNFVNGNGPDGPSPDDPSSNSSTAIPMFGFGITSQHLNVGEKRPLEDPLDREGNKRSRFQVIE